jgi:hypothetical protein
VKETLSTFSLCGGILPTGSVTHLRASDIRNGGDATADSPTSTVTQFSPLAALDKPLRHDVTGRTYQGTRPSAGRRSMPAGRHWPNTPRPAGPAEGCRWPQTSRCPCRSCWCLLRFTSGHAQGGARLTSDKVRASRRWRRYGATRWATSHSRR